ncbi:MAG: methyltransferase [Calditrichia bacterium]
MVKENHPPLQKINELASQYRETIILLTAVRENLFDLFQVETYLTAETVSRKLRWTLHGTRILLNALCSLGILKKKEENYTLCRGCSEILEGRGFPLLKARLLHQWRLMNRWMQLPQILRGFSLNDLEKFAGQEQDVEEFSLAMAFGEQAAVAELLSRVQFPPSGKFLDWGGGPGLFAVRVAEHYPEVDSYILDRPEVEPVARRFIQKSPAAKRIHFIAGDFFATNPGQNFQAVLLSNIIHIYTEEENLQLLNKIRDCLKPGGTLYVRDFFLNADLTGPRSAALFSVNMLVNTDGGRSYSAEEVRRWLKQTGFKYKRRYRLHGPADVILAVKPLKG